jgi:hypothetical protein
VEALRKENNNAYTAGLFRTPKMSLCYFLEQKPQYAATFSNFGNFPKKCPIHAVSVCNLIWFCNSNTYASYRNMNHKYKGPNLNSAATSMGLYANISCPSALISWAGRLKMHTKV